MGTPEVDEITINLGNDLKLELSIGMDEKIDFVFSEYGKHADFYLSLSFDYVAATAIANAIDHFIKRLAGDVLFNAQSQFQNENRHYDDRDSADDKRKAIADFIYQSRLKNL